MEAFSLKFTPPKKVIFGFVEACFCWQCKISLIDVNPKRKFRRNIIITIKGRNHDNLN